MTLNKKLWSVDFVIYMEYPVENTFFHQEKGRRKWSPLSWACGCKAPRRWNALSMCNTPRGIKRGYLSHGLCCRLCPVFWHGLCHKKYLVFNFAIVIPRTSVAMINLFLPAKISKTREPSFVKIQASKIFGSIGEG